MNKIQIFLLRSAPCLHVIVILTAMNMHDTNGHHCHRLANFMFGNTWDFCTDPLAMHQSKKQMLFSIQATTFASHLTSQMPMKHISQ